MNTLSDKNTVKKIFPALGMSCASCARHIEQTIRKLPGVSEATVNFATANAHVEYWPGSITPQQIREAVQENGYDLLIEEEDEKEDPNLTGSIEDINRKKLNNLRNKTIIAILLSLPVVIIGMFLMNIPFANEIMWILSTPIIFWLGKDFFLNAWKQAKHGTANMDTLVALSTSVAYLFSVFNTLYPEFWHQRGLHPHVYFEAASVIISFILLGRLLEEKAKGRTSSSIKKLMGLQPRTVTIIRANEEQVQLLINKVTTGDLILVKPGERIAVDGSVTEGSSYVDESMLTGEPVAVLKQQGSPVYAGTINQKGSFRFRAEKVGSQTMLAQIIRLVQDAQGSKAPVQQLVDKIAGIFVPVVITIAVAAFLAWIILGGNIGFTQGLLAFVTVLIIACPCALGLATPTALMVGIGKGAEHGILIKDAESLELCRKINAVVLDKTGTITEGKPVVADVFWLNNNDSRKNILLSLEKQSEHPLAEAIVSHFNELSLNKISDYESIPGKGLKGRVKETTYFVGNRKLLKDNKIQIHESLEQKAESLTDSSQTLIWFADSHYALALIAVNDTIRETAMEAIQQLQTEGIEVYMLTGDNESAAKETAKKTGIKQYASEMLPIQKLEFIQQLQTEGKTVAMVGDGINDSAALAQSDVSIAMGKGSDIAMEVAQMTIISSDLTRIPEAIRLSRQTVRTIRQNLFWAFIYNLIGIPIAAGLLYPVNGFLLNPMIAGAAMALSSVSVVGNSLRLRHL